MADLGAPEITRRRPHGFLTPDGSRSSVHCFPHQGAVRLQASRCPAAIREHRTAVAPRLHVASRGRRARFTASPPRIRSPYEDCKCDLPDSSVDDTTLLLAGIFWHGECSALAASSVRT
jgi:hypothetical protein